MNIAYKYSLTMKENATLQPFNRRGILIMVLGALMETFLVVIEKKSGYKGVKR